MKSKQTALKVLFIVTLLFFVIVNTGYYWEGVLGGWSFPVFLILILLFVILVVALSYQVYYIISEKFKNKLRNGTFAMLLLVTALTVYKPYGLIDFESFEGEDRLVAYNEGVANCMTTFKLKDTGKFSNKVVCFGIEKTEGEYKIKGDTILFTGRNVNDMEYAYGIIDGENLFLYRSVDESKPFSLEIIKNTLKKDIAAK